MFVSPVDEVEVIDVIDSCKNKTSTDCNGVGMILVKRVMASITTPITHIVCDIYFIHGVFP